MRTIFTVTLILTFLASVSYANEIAEAPLPNQGISAVKTAIPAEKSDDVSRETKAIKVASLDILDSKTLSRVEEEDARQREYEMIRSMQIEKDIQTSREKIQIGSWKDVEENFQRKLIVDEYREILRDVPEIDDEMVSVVDHIIDEIDVEISALQQQLNMLDSQIEELKQHCEMLDMPNCRVQK